MATLVAHLVFVFAVFGTKIVLALWAIYYLFPAGKPCPDCDAETLPIQLSASQRFWGVLLVLGRVRRRWCPECAWEGFARRSPAAAVLPSATRIEDAAGRSESLR
jgi:hypothetical protein